MPHTVVVSTGSRLHFGLLSNGRTGSRQFGGVGMMIDRPGFSLTAAAAERDELICSAELEHRARSIVVEYRRRCPPRFSPPPVRIEISSAIPAHAGLGSGTQLGMAVAEALAVLSGETAASAIELASRTGRGARSALGLHGFRQGGFLVEGGKASTDHISPLVARIAFPQNWSLLLVRPPLAAGLSGEAELSGFSRLEPMPQRTTDRLCGIALLELLPAVVEANFEQFGEALYEFGQVVGEYFAPVQGGHFAHPEMATLAEQLREMGIRGVAQTSWGPTLCAVCPDEVAATALSGQLASLAAWSACEFTVAQPLNEGRKIEDRE